MGVLHQSASPFNHPEIEWKTVSTKHFNINYYDKTEPAVYPTWKIAEEAYDALADLYGYRFVDRIDISMADYDDYSNGWAAWTERNIGIWLPDADFDLRGNTTWLRNVITHELAHIISMEKGKGMQLLAWSFLFHYESPSLGVTLSEPVPFMTFVPQWFAEGAAQMGAQRLGNDCWDSRRDMVLRCAALDDRLLTLDEMGHFTHDWVRNEMVYNQGYSLTRHMEKRFGAKNVAQVWNASRSRKILGLDFNKNVRDRLGISMVQLYGQWRDSVTSAAKSRVPSEPTPVNVVSSRGTFNALVRVSRDGRYVGMLTNQNDDSRRTDLVVVSRDGAALETRVKYARASWDFHPDGKRLFYVKARDPDEHGSFYNDLFAYDMSTRKETRLTTSARVYDIAFAPDGKSICCVRFRDGAFALERFLLDRGIFATVVAGTPGEPFLSVSYPPHSSDTVVVSRLVAGKANLFVVDLKTGLSALLTASQAQEESPHWGSDNRIYFSADYDGIFNIYSVRPDGSELKRHTRVIGGAFSPWRTVDGRILFTEYTSKGFRVAECSGEGAAFEVSNRQVCISEPLPTPKGRVTIRAKDYRSKMLRPVWQLTSSAIVLDTSDAVRDRIDGEGRGALINQLDMALTTSLALTRDDALGKKGMYLGVAGEIMPARSPKNPSDSLQSSRRDIAHMPLTRENALRRAEPPRLRRARNDGYVLPLAQGYIENAAAAAGDSLGSSDDSVTIPLPLLVPFFGRTNRNHTPTFGLDVQGVLLTVMPMAMLVSPWVEIQLGREVYCGATPQIMVMPMLLPAGTGVVASFPLWLEWFRYGYYNQDIEYNLGDVTLLSVSISPEVSPVTRISGAAAEEEAVSSDTSVTNEVWLAGGLDFRHGFPILRYASVSPKLQGYWALLGNRITDPAGVLDGESRAYAQVGTGVDFVFPIVRNINRGRLYGDNLYAALSYDLSVYGNSSFFGGPDFSVIGDPLSDTADVSVAHTVGAAVEFGFIKNYLFSRRLCAGVSWEFVKKQVFVSFRMLM